MHFLDYYRKSGWKIIGELVNISFIPFFTSFRESPYLFYLFKSNVFKIYFHANYIYVFDFLYLINQKLNYLYTELWH